MKKIVLSIAAVMAAAAFAPEASALPVFARQTGMACTACHFQHFPLLNGFGRAFKSAGYTMMGAQGKIEGEELSIPDTLNLGIFTTVAYQTQSGTAGNPNTVPKWLVPSTGGELSMFVGGRISEFAGFLAELGMGGGGPGAVTAGPNAAAPFTGATAAGGGIATSAKLAMLFPVGDARVGLVAYSDVGQGAAYSFELLNTGAVGTHKMMGNTGPSNQHDHAAYAAQYLNTKGDASGVSIVANNTMGFINVGRYEFAGNNAVGGANSLPLTYARIAATFDLAGFDSAVGVQSFSGTSLVTGATTKATIIDGQMQGEIAGYAAGIYAGYGRAPAVSNNVLAVAQGAAAVPAVVVNPILTGGVGTPAAVGSFNSSATVATTTFNIAGEMALIPHGTVQLAFRSATRDGVDALSAAAGTTSVQGTSTRDNAVLVGATYELAQNLGLSLHYTTQSGSYWSNQVTPLGKNATTLLLEAAF
jgi:hypothetical protein